MNPRPFVKRLSLHGPARNTRETPQEFEDISAGHSSVKNNLTVGILSASFIYLSSSSPGDDFSSLFAHSGNRVISLLITLEKIRFIGPHVSGDCGRVSACPQWQARQIPLSGVISLPTCKACWSVNESCFSLECSRPPGLAKK